MKKPRIVFMGTPDFGLPALEALWREFEVCAVVTQPDRPAGRGQKIIKSPVKRFAERRGIPVLQPVKLSDIKDELEALAPDFIITAAFGQLLDSDILAIPARACINIHASLLPDLRGASPINQAIIRGDRKSGVTTFIMDEGMDTGDILLKIEIEIGEGETAGELHDRLAKVAEEIAVRTILEFDSIVPEKQVEEQATYSGKMKKVDGRVNWSNTAGEISNRVRGCAPWPGAFTFHNGRYLKLLRVESTELPEGKDATPGTVLNADSEGILVSTGGGGAVLIREIQMEGKKRQTVDTFLRGYEIKEGDVFGSYE